MITLSGLKQVFDNLDEGILFLDQQRRVIAINEAASRMLGQNHDTILSRLCPSLFQGTACARDCEKRGHCALMVNARKEEKKVQDIVVKRPDGASIQLRMWAMVLPSEEPMAPSSGKLSEYCAVVLRGTQW